MHPLKKYWLDFFETEERSVSDNWWERKKALLKRRNAEIIRINGKGHIFQELRHENNTGHQYLMHLSFLIKQGDYFYIEEQVIPYEFQLQNNKVANHRKTYQLEEEEGEALKPDLERDDSGSTFTYDRLAAVQYAERWWNDYHPNFEKFAVDCTNFVSQCLYAGGAPMRGEPNRAKGWWYKNDN